MLMMALPVIWLTFRRFRLFNYTLVILTQTIIDNVINLDQTLSPTHTYTPTSVWQPMQLISPVVKVSGNRRKPLQGDGIMMLLDHLGCHWHRRRFGGRLPGLVDEIQVAVHPGHLVQCEGVRAGIICRYQGQLEEWGVDFGLISGRKNK